MGNGAEDILGRILDPLRTFRSHRTSFSFIAPSLPPSHPLLSLLVILAPKEDTLESFAMHVLTREYPLRTVVVNFDFDITPTPLYVTRGSASSSERGVI